MPPTPAAAQPAPPPSHPRPLSMPCGPRLLSVPCGPRQYNNMWMVVDYKRFSKGAPLPPSGVLTIAEQVRWTELN